jgi:hypothetical protein
VPWDQPTQHHGACQGVFAPRLRAPAAGSEGWSVAPIGGRVVQGGPPAALLEPLDFADIIFISAFILPEKFSCVAWQLLPESGSILFYRV